MTHEQQGFIDPAGLTKWVKIFLYAQIAIIFVALISSALEYQLLAEFDKGTYASRESAEEAAEANDARQSVVAGVQLIVFIITGIWVLRWIHRANYNARQLGAKEMVFTPGWAVGWYFVPLFTLWKPYQAMKEIWKAIAAPQAWKSQKAPGLLPWWWFFWITSNIFGYVSFRLSLEAKSVSDLMATNVLTQVSDYTGLASAFLILALINRIHKMQVSQANAELPPPLHPSASV